MTKKEQLLDMLIFAGQEFDRAVSSLTEDERLQSGTPGQWGTRDNLVHIATWTRRGIQRLRSYRGVGELPPDVEFQEHNEQFFEEFRYQPWENLEGYFSTAQTELIQELNRFSEEELITPDLFPGLDVQPLWRNIYGNGFEHVMYHLGIILISRGETDRAIQFYETETLRTLALDDSDEFRGVALYNLGCHYAVAGMRTQALAKVEQALPLYPYLYEWAPQDGDLVDLWDDSEFIRLLKKSDTGEG